MEKSLFFQSQDLSFFRTASDKRFFLWADIAVDTVHLMVRILRLSASVYSHEDIARIGVIFQILYAEIGVSRENEIFVFGVVGAARVDIFLGQNGFVLLQLVCILGKKHLLVVVGAVVLAVNAVSNQHSHPLALEIRCKGDAVDA